MAHAVLTAIQQQTGARSLGETVESIDNKEQEVVGSMQTVQNLSGDVAELEATRMKLQDDVDSIRKKVAALGLPGGSLFKRQQLQRQVDLHKQRRAEAEAELEQVNGLLGELLVKLQNGFGAVDADEEDMLMHSARESAPKAVATKPFGQGLMSPATKHSNGTNDSAGGDQERGMVRKVSLLQLTHDTSNVTKQASLRRSPSFSHRLSNRSVSMNAPFSPSRRS